jgi:hypothetical protein
MYRNTSTFALIAIIVTISLVAIPAQASITYSGSSGSLAAEASFDLSGGNLVITLTNTSTSDVLIPTEILTALFFDINPSTPLTKISAVLGAGSTVLFGSTDAGGVVGGEWAYKPGLSGAPASAGLGVSSAGLGLFGPSDLFPGSNLQGPGSPDGLQYGITSAGDNAGTGNAEVTGSNALIKNSVVFTFGVQSGFTLDSISNVQFQYGTGLGDPHFSSNNVPEPTTVIIWSMLFGLGFAWFKMRK